MQLYQALTAHIFVFMQIDCYLCIHSGNSSGSINDTCRPTRHMADVLWFFIVRHKRESAKSYPKRHMGYYGRWWYGSFIIACGKRQWFGWKFTSINAILGNFLQLLQYCLILHYMIMIVTLSLAYPYLELPNTLTKPNWTKSTNSATTQLKLIKPTYSYFKRLYN